MPGGMGGMNQAAMIKQAQKMQQEMLRMQEEQENRTFSAQSGGGMVFFLFQEKNQYQTIRDSDNPEPVESRFPAVCSCDRCSEATQCLSGVEPGHVDSDS